jgi:DNA-binding transcriptional regulator YdaS (Cro superfamily)
VLKANGVDRWLTEAIRRCGSRRQFAFKLGMSSQAVACWSRAPAERVVQIEAVTGVARYLLRPDLYQAPE